jgi:hypothetical protein
MTTNTSFEHLVFNIQDRESIIQALHESLKTLTNHLTNRSLNIFISHINSNYKRFAQAISELNLGMIGIISDYYSIMDEHADQFHPKYLSLYTSHKNHYNNFMQMDSSVQFDFKELVDIFTEHCYEFKKFKPHTEIGHLRRARDQSKCIYNKLSIMIASKNIYELSDNIAQDISLLVSKLKPLATDHTTINTMQDLLTKYEYTKLEIVSKEEIFDYCECGNVMEVMASSSEMVCDNCGFVTKLIGTVFEDNQFYNQEGGRYRHAGYEPSKHCRCWLERIQAKETNTITPQQLEKLEACIRRDRITNKRRVTISQLRSYLKDAGLTELNEHVALIKKIITGIIPPQLTFAETQDITNSFSKAVKAYNVVRPSNKSNNIYYPYILRKLIEMHINDYNKQKELLSFIHLQGSQTLIQNDKIWRDICNITPSFAYQPTDRYAFVD